MAKQTIVQIIDDLSGQVIPDGQSETVTFGLDGHTYEIDLSKENAAELRDALAEFVAHARKAGPARKARSSAPKSSTEVSEARTWLKENGYEVKDKGRIPQDLMDIYNQRNVGSDAVDEAPEPEPEVEEDEDTPADAPELDTSDQAVIAWHESRGLKVNQRQIGLMRHRYLKAHAAAS